MQQWKSNILTWISFQCLKAKVYGISTGTNMCFPSWIGIHLWHVFSAQMTLLDSVELLSFFSWKRHNHMKFYILLLGGYLAPSHYINQCWIKVNNWTIKNKIQWNLNRSTIIFIQGNALVNAVYKMMAILFRFWGDNSNENCVPYQPCKYS